MTIFNYGKQDHLSVNDDFSNGDTILAGNGAYDFVSVANGIFDAIKLAMALATQ
jgi:hypothetical protein